MKQLSGHPNIVKFIDASFIDHTKSARANAEYLLVTELCKGGSLIDCMGTSFEPDTVLKIIYQISRAIGHMHSQNPPITHRDIKVCFFLFSIIKNCDKICNCIEFQIENFLLTADGELKLCDFGSATTETYAPDVSWSAQQRDTLEDQVNC